jgi:L-threonylcarbamoyladenylate synthase
LDILEDLNGKPDLIIDGGIVENVPSTIVNCRIQPPVIERTGRISYEELQKILNNE